MAKLLQVMFVGLTLVGCGAAPSGGGGLPPKPTDGGTPDSGMAVPDGGTTPGGESGHLSITEVGFSEPALATGPDGIFHVTFNSGASPSVVFYGQCKRDCHLGPSWKWVTLESTTNFAAHARLGVGPTGRVHVVYELGGPSSEERTIYASCAGSCDQGGNWAKTELTPLQGYNAAAYRSAPLVVDSQDRVSFITDDLTVNAKVLLTTCASGCDQLSNWKAGYIRTGGHRMEMAAGGTTLHMVLNNDFSALVYRTCSANCTEEASWQESPPLFTHNGQSAVSLTATPGGALKLAYNQGTAPDNESDAVKAQNRKMLVWTCPGNCAQQASWKGVVLGELGEGDDGLKLVSAGDTMVLTTTTVSELRVRVCSAGCEDAQAWTGGVVDSSEAISAAVDPYAIQGCSSNGMAVRPAFAAWYPNAPAVTLTPSGGALFVHAPYILRTCSGSGSPTRLPGIGRVIWAP